MILQLNSNFAIQPWLMNYLYLLIFVHHKKNNYDLLQVKNVHSLTIIKIIFLDYKFKKEIIMNISD